MLKEIKQQPNESVIKWLEACWEDAKQGKIIEYVLCGRYEKGQVITSKAGDHSDVYTMYGLLMSAAQDYKDEHIES